MTDEFRIREVDGETKAAHRLEAAGRAGTEALLGEGRRREYRERIAGPVRMVDERWREAAERPPS